jgi:crotonobetainyl-CoA:carnitine CoA-transferase CaiB-like acyl-CoA transferase
VAETEPAGPMAGIRVLDIATFLAAPFAGVILADFGAEVIKIEQPGGGDPLRRFGTPTDCGDTYVWLSEARNKESVTLDLRTPEGADLFRRLVAVSDVVLENFRPGTLERWGLGYDVLSAINPKLVLLRVSAYGQTGPARMKPGFARIAHGFSGLAHLAGHADGPPVMPGSTSLADYISGLWGAVGVMAALREAEASGLGQVIDIALYDSVFRLLDEIAPVYAAMGKVRGRMGADTATTVPHSHYECADGKWVALACSSEKMFERLATAMERPEIAREGPWKDNARRLDHRDAVNAAVQAWFGTMDRETALATCERFEVPCGPIYDIADIFADPQFRAREDVEEVPSRAGPVTLPAPVPRLSRTPARLRRAGPGLGEDTETVLARLLSLSLDEIAALRARGAL